MWHFSFFLFVQLLILFLRRSSPSHSSLPTQRKTKWKDKKVTSRESVTNVLFLRKRIAINDIRLSSNSKFKWGLRFTQSWTSLPQSWYPQLFEGTLTVCVLFSVVGLCVGVLIFGNYIAINGPKFKFIKFISFVSCLSHVRFNFLFLRLADSQCGARRVPDDFNFIFIDNKSYIRKGIFPFYSCKYSKCFSRTLTLRKCEITIANYFQCFLSFTQVSSRPLQTTRGGPGGEAIQFRQKEHPPASSQNRNIELILNLIKSFTFAINGLSFNSIVSGTA